MGKLHEKEKKRGKEKIRKEKERKRNYLIFANRITILLYSTFERVSVVFYYATLS